MIFSKLKHSAISHMFVMLLQIYFNGDMILLCCDFRQYVHNLHISMSLVEDVGLLYMLAAVIVLVKFSITRV